MLLLRRVAAPLLHRRQPCAAIGEAVGLLLARGTASMLAVALLALAIYGLLLAALGLAMLYMFDQSCHGLHYFVGVTDRNTSDSGHGKTVWQVRRRPPGRLCFTCVLQQAAWMHGPQWDEAPQGHTLNLRAYNCTALCIFSASPGSIDSSAHWIDAMP